MRGEQEGRASVGRRPPCGLTAIKRARVRGVPVAPGAPDRCGKLTLNHADARQRRQR
jgi:hypothetical protein